MARWLALWSIVLVAVAWPTGMPSTAQTGGAAAFEVASVKPVKPEIPLQRPFACAFGPGGRFRAFGTLQMLIACAYRIPAALNERQIFGGPKWLTVDLFDIEAKSPPEQVPGSPTESLVMLQTLLAERFKLVVHRQLKELSIYALVLARRDRKLGPQLRPTLKDCSSWIAGGRQGAPPAVPGDMPCGRQLLNAFAIRGTAMPMSQLASLLSARLDRTVQDQTGLTGSFALDLQWRPDQAATMGAGPDIPTNPNSAGDHLPTSIFTAMQEQLGLRLRPAKGSIEMIIVDHAEHPTTN
jgi:uncharacterized protein (TIGR03435 family)